MKAAQGEIIKTGTRAASGHCSTSTFGNTILRPVPSSSARMSTLYLPTLASFSSSLIGMPISSLNWTRFSSCASQLEKSYSSFFQISLRSTLVSLPMLLAMSQIVVCGACRCKPGVGWTQDTASAFSK